MRTKTDDGVTTSVQKTKRPLTARETKRVHRRKKRITHQAERASHAKVFNALLDDVERDFALALIAAPKGS